MTSQQYSSIHPTVLPMLPVAIAVLKSHRVQKAYFFGSVCTETFGVDSDIDILVAFEPELPPLQRGALHLDLYDALEKVFQRKVDIVTEDHLTNPFFIKVLNKTKMPLYE